MSGVSATSLVHHRQTHPFQEGRQVLAAQQSAPARQVDEELAQKWRTLGFPASVLEHHEDCAKFLIDSKVAFAIAGYRQTCGDSMIHDLKLDNDGHPLIKMQDGFVRWETIAGKLEFDPRSDKIRSREYQADQVQTWNYFHPQGLIPVDRFNYDQVFPIYQLGQEEYRRLMDHAMKFYETNPERDPGTPKDCVVQFFTSPRRQGIPESPLWTNLHENYPVHVAIRLITADRQVYSFGYQMPFEEQNTVLSNYFSTFATTALVKVSMLDYEEFRTHEGRMVTSIPASSQRGADILDFLNALNRSSPRFQFLRQNCTLLVSEVLHRTGYEVQMRTSIGSVLVSALPPLAAIPGIGPVAAKVERAWGMVPRPVRGVLSLPPRAVLWLSQKPATLMTNLLVWKIGGGKMTAPLPAGTREEPLSDRQRIQNFSRVIRSWTDIFRSETSAVSHAKFFLKWQKEQKSTFVQPGNEPPQLAIVPPGRVAGPTRV